MIPLQLPIYQLQNIRKFHGRQLAVDIATLSIPAASITGLVGPNGSGKSSLLKLLAFVDSPSEGDIWFNGVKATRFSASVRFHVCLLPQEPYLLKRSVFDNIAYGLTLRGIRKSRCSRAVMDALSLVGLSGKEFAGRPWYQLSGGEAQRVALAARLALNPEVLILDEPTASVDAASAQQIKSCALNASRDRGVTLVIVSHDWQWLYDISDNVIQMFRGKVIPSCMENIVSGPWRQESDGSWGKPLPDGQYLRVSEPPDADAVAAIPPDSIWVSRALPLLKPVEHAIQSVVTRMTLETPSGNVRITLKAAEISLSFFISVDTAQAMNLFPGQRFYIVYPVSSVVWY